MIRLRHTAFATTAIAALALTLAAPSAVAAQDLTVTARAGINVRAEPGVQSRRVGSMAENSSGTLLECTPEGRWCRVRAPLATGWAAGAFLIVANGPQRGRRVRDVASQLVFSAPTPGTEEAGRGTASATGSDTAVASIGSSQAAQPAAEALATGTPQVCFHADYDAQGEADCYGDAEEQITLGRAWNDRIQSVTIPDGFEVTVCDNYGLIGRCETFDSTVTRMPAALSGRISSWRIRRAG